MKAALDPDQTDILSAYSSEQGFSPSNACYCTSHCCCAAPAHAEPAFACAGFREVSVLQLKQQLDVDAERPFVLDVRTAWEYTRGHIPGAVNISLDDLSSKVRALLMRCCCVRMLPCNSCNASLHICPCMQPCKASDLAYIRLK